MIELATLARPYAEAAFKRAVETDTTEKWLISLTFVSSVVKNREFVTILGNPKVSKTKLTNLLFDICAEYLDQESENFFKLLIQNNKLQLADKILELYQEQKANAEGYINVDVSTAYIFSKDDERKFAETLATIFHKIVHLSIRVDKSLIGGFIAKAGDQVIDGSIKGQLQIMQKTLQ